jgi:hypothetical protein
VRTARSSASRSCNIDISSASGTHEANFTACDSPTIYRRPQGRINRPTAATSASRATCARNPIPRSSTPVVAMRRRRVQGESGVGRCARERIPPRLRSLRVAHQAGPALTAHVNSTAYAYGMPVRRRSDCCRGLSVPPTVRVTPRSTHVPARWSMAGQA